MAHLTAGMDAYFYGGLNRNCNTSLLHLSVTTIMMTTKHTHMVMPTVILGMKTRTIII